MQPSGWKVPGAEVHTTRPSPVVLAQTAAQDRSLHMLQAIITRMAEAVIGEIWFGHPLEYAMA